MDKLNKRSVGVTLSIVFGLCSAGHVNAACPWYLGNKSVTGISYPSLAFGGSNLSFAHLNGQAIIAEQNNWIPAIAYGMAGMTDVSVDANSSVGMKSLKMIVPPSGVNNSIPGGIFLGKASNLRHIVPCTLSATTAVALQPGHMQLESGMTYPVTANAVGANGVKGASALTIKVLQLIPGSVNQTLTWNTKNATRVQVYLVSGNSAALIDDTSDPTTVSNGTFPELASNTPLSYMIFALSPKANGSGIKFGPCNANADTPDRLCSDISPGAIMLTGGPDTDTAAFYVQFDLPKASQCTSGTASGNASILGVPVDTTPTPNKARAFYIAIPGPYDCTMTQPTIPQNMNSVTATVNAGYYTLTATTPFSSYQQKSCIDISAGQVWCQITQNPGNRCFPPNQDLTPAYCPTAPP